MKVLSVFLAVIPVLTLLSYIFCKDKVEKEPISLLIKLFIGGALMAISTIFISDIISSYIEWDPIIFHAFIKVALLEETLKFLILYILVWKNKEFNYIYDAIIYSVFVSLGFACFENVIYSLEYNLLTTFLRAIISVPGHAFFAVYMGYYLGKAKYLNIQNNDYKTTILKCILIPTLLHGYFNFSVVSSSIYLYILFIIFIISLYIFSFKKIKDVSKNDFCLEKNAD